MEILPSSIINNEVHEPLVVDLLTTTPQATTFESPFHFAVLGAVDEVEIELANSFCLIKGGRETKPPIKYQDMKWKTVRERGKHDRCGRGSYH